MGQGFPLDDQRVSAAVAHLLGRNLGHELTAGGAALSQGMEMAAVLHNAYWCAINMGVSTNGGTPIAGWFIMDNPNLKWMMTGGTPFGSITIF